MESIWPARHDINVKNKCNTYSLNAGLKSANYQNIKYPALDGIKKNHPSRQKCNLFLIKLAI